MTKLLVYILLIFVAIPYAEEYRYMDNSPLFLGACIDPSSKKVSEMRRKSAVDGSTKQIDQGSSEFLIDIKQIQARQELYRETQVDVSLSAKYSFFSGSSSISNFQSFRFSNDTVVWMIKAAQSYGRRTLVDLKLKPKAKELLDQGESERFLAEYGSHLVHQETRQASIIALFMLTSTSQNVVKKFSSELNFAIGKGAFSAEGKARYKKAYLEAMQRSTFTLKVFGFGGSGLKNLGSIVEDPSDLEKVRKALASYIEGLNVDNSVAVKYSTIPLSVVDGRLSQPTFGSWRLKNLRDLYMIHMDAQANLEQIRMVKRRVSGDDLTRMKRAHVKHSGYGIIYGKSNCEGRNFITINILILNKKTLFCI